MTPARLTRRLSVTLLARVLLLFWALYFTVVALSNLTELLKALHLLPSTWSWVSGNLGFMASGTAKLGAPLWLNRVLLAGVIVWETAAAALFWRALGRPREEAVLVPPFVVSLALWAGLRRPRRGAADLRDRRGGHAPAALHGGAAHAHCASSAPVRVGRCSARC